MRVDGLLELDLSRLPHCAPVLIPGLEIPLGERIPAGHQTAQQRACTSLLAKLKFVNAFKACFTSAMSHVQHHAMGADPPNLPGSYLPLPGRAVFDARAALGFSPHLDAKLRSGYENLSEARTLVRLETLEFAAKRFESVVKHGEEFALLVDLLYHQHHLFFCHRFAECLIGRGR